MAHARKPMSVIVINYSAGSWIVHGWLVWSHMDRTVQQGKGLFSACGFAIGSMEMVHRTVRSVYIKARVLWTKSCFTITPWPRGHKTIVTKIM